MAEKTKRIAAGIGLVALGAAAGWLAHPTPKPKPIQLKPTYNFIEDNGNYTMAAMRFHLADERKTDAVAVVDMRRVVYAGNLDSGTLQSLIFNYSQNDNAHWDVIMDTPPVHFFMSSETAKRIENDARARKKIYDFVSPDLRKDAIVLEEGRCNPQDPNSPSISWGDLTFLIDQTIPQVQRLRSYTMKPSEMKPYTPEQ